MTHFLKAHWKILCLAIITAIGFVLRIYHLGFQDYFSEEIFTVHIVNTSYYHLITDPVLRAGSEQPPLYYLLAKISSDLMGSVSLESIRFPSAILGTLSIPAIYALGKKYHSEIAGLIAALVYALSERMVFYSQYGRPYTLVFLFFILAAYYFINIQRNGPSLKYMILFSASSVLCLMSHYYSIIPLLVLWSALIWQHRTKITPYLAIAAIASTSFLLYIKNIILFYATHPLSGLYTKTPFNLTWVDNLTLVPYECFGYLGCFLILLALFYLFTRKDITTRSFILAAGLTYLSILLSTIFFNPSARYAVLIAPLIIVAAAAPLSDFIESFKNVKHRIALGIGIIYVVLIINIFPLIAWYTTAFRFIFI